MLSLSLSLSDTSLRERGGGQRKEGLGGVGDTQRGEKKQEAALSLSFVRTRLVMPTSTLETKKQKTEPPAAAGPRAPQATAHVPPRRFHRLPRGLGAPRPHRLAGGRGGRGARGRGELLLCALGGVVGVAKWRSVSISNAFSVVVIVVAVCLRFGGVLGLFYCSVGFGDSWSSSASRS